MALKKAERNRLLEAISLYGLSVQDFGEGHNAEEMNILHRPTQHSFHIYWKEISQGPPPIQPQIVLTYRTRTFRGDSGLKPAADFPEILKEYEGWLRRVWLRSQEIKQEEETPDLWDILVQNPGAFDRDDWTSKPEQDNSRFSLQEQEAIAEKLTGIEATIRDAYSLDDDQQLRIAGDLRYLAEQATHQKRREWANIAKGTFVSWAWEAILPSGAARAIVLGLLLPLLRFISGHLPSPLFQLPPGH